MRIGLWFVFPAIGGVLGWFLPGLADWVADLPAVPQRGTFRFVAELPRGPATLVACGVGVLAGLFLAAIAASERLTVTVTRDEVELRRGDSTTRVPRAQVGAAFVDGSRFVLVDREGAEVAREKHELKAAELATALRAHGYPWHAEDPFRDAYQVWVAGSSALPPGADALLASRSAAVRKGRADDADRLRTELARLGVVVRDERKTQYWRPLTPR